MVFMVYTELAQPKIQNYSICRSSYPEYNIITRLKKLNRLND
jgi:hypothetical protein